MGYLDYLGYGKKLFYKKNTPPIYVVFFVTLDCNARCKHCLLGEQKAPPNELRLDEIEKISAHMHDFLFLLPTGGQPFMRPDLAEIVKVFCKNNKVRNVVVPTNGTFRARTIKFVQEVMQSCPELDLGVDVSIDGIKERHDEIRGVPGLFDIAIGTYKELRKLERTYPRFNVNVETTVSSYNQDQLVELYNYLLKEVGVNTVFTLLTRGSPSDPISKNFDIAKYEEYAHIMERDIKNRVLRGYDSFPFCDFINAKRIIRHRLIAKTVRERRYQTPCYAGTLGACIFSTGEVLPCELLTHKAMGNLREHDYDFNRIWFGPKGEEARKFIRETKCFCTYECFHTLNILFNPLMLSHTLKEWASLKWGKLRHKEADIARDSTMEAGATNPPPVEPGGQR